MVRTKDCDHVVSQGTIRDGSTRVDFYTTIPTPSQWIAVGVLVWSEFDEKVRRSRRMLVGTGRDEDTAIADLRKRFKHMRTQSQARESNNARRPAGSEKLRREAQHPATGDVRADAELVSGVESRRA